MSFPATCPACGARCRFPDSQAGKHVRCRDCRERFLAAPAEDVPRRREQGEAAQGKSVVPWVVGGLGALALAMILLCAGGFFYFPGSAGRFAGRGIGGGKKMPPPPAGQPPPPPAPAPREVSNVDEALAGLRSPDAAR